MPVLHYLLLFLLLLNACTDKASGPKATCDCPHDTQLIPVDKDGRFGYIDTTGKLIIPLQFDTATPFSEGLAVVRTGGKTGYINTLGTLVIPANFEDALPFSNDRAVVRSGGKWGIIRKDGNWAVPPAYDKVVLYTDRMIAHPTALYNSNYTLESASDTTFSWIGRSFRHGAIEFKIHGKWGLLSKDGGVLTTPQYDGKGTWSEGMLAVKKQGHWTFTDSSGHLLSGAYDSVGEFSEGYAAVCVREKWGYIDQRGKLRLNPEWSEAAPFHSGLAWVQTIHAQGYFIHKNGERINDSTYDNSSGFSETAAAVSRNGKWALIDKEGNTITSFLYDHINLRNSMFICSAKGNYSVYDGNGRLLLTGLFDEIADVHCDRFAVRKKNYWGIVDCSGKIILPISNAGVLSFFDHDHCYARISVPAGQDNITGAVAGRQALVNRNGKQIWQY